ncbi:MAG: tetratricopeptide repeat protein [Deltaproteobacteria bacterium]|nr:tetratricopeptide repeat protein [Deltaproteobacteria bacterium]
MDIKKAFDESRFLDIADAADEIKRVEDRLMLGISLHKLGKAKDALEVFRNIYEHIDSLIRAVFYMGIIHKDLGDMDLATDYIRCYLAFRPDDDEAKDVLSSESTSGLISEPSLELARLYTKQGHFKEAVDIYAKLSATSDDPEVKKEAIKTQNMHIIRTLEGWLEVLNR